jgi:hypothetical protein
VLDVHAEPVAAEVEPYEVGDGALVLDHEDQPTPGAVIRHRPIMTTGVARRHSGSVRAL